MSSIPGLTSITPAASSFLSGTPASAPRQQLNQDDFLKLLTTQLSNQDPLKPMDDTQFIAQMAQFSSLQQATTLTKDFEAFSSAQQISSAQNLLSRTVSLTSDDAVVTGPVSEVRIKNGAAQIIVNDTAYDPSTVTSITSSTVSKAGA